MDSTDVAEIDIAGSPCAPSRGGMDSAGAAEMDMADSPCAPSRGGLESADAADLAVSYTHLTLPTILLV